MQEFEEKYRMLPSSPYYTNSVSTLIRVDEQNTIYFWKSRAKHHKGQIGMTYNLPPWSFPRHPDIVYVDNLEIAMAVAKLKGWL